MFETAGCTGEDLAARLVANEAELRHRECEVLVLAAGGDDECYVVLWAVGPTETARRRRPPGPGQPAGSPWCR